ncbi:MAG: hypothetical protein ACXVA9_10065, partial [Bdellovibrionales bacterium]
ERVTILELANRIPAVIADSTTCAKLFANTNLYSTASMPFDSGSITAKSPYLFAINSLYDNGLQPFADAGTYLRGTSHTVFVKKQTDNPPGLQIAITQMNPPMAFLYIHFDQTQLVHAVADIGFRILLKTTGTAAATRVTGCVGSRG